ncbi:hypothetical protein EMCRGX_G005278 [Ephydatia muelleri]
MAWEDRYKYLGVKTGADHTSDLGGLGKEYTSDVEAIMKSELTDWQKMDAIHRFAKPRLVYALQNQFPPTGWAKAIDKRMKALVKSAMKLPRRSMDAFLFSPWRAGGLGLPRLEDEVHIYRISSAYRLLALSQDPLVSDVSQAALEVTARKRSKGLTSPQDFLNSPSQRGEGKQGDIQSLWSGVRVSLQRCQSTIDLAKKEITIEGRSYGPSKRHLNCGAMRSVLQRKHLTSWARAKDQGRAVQCVSAHESSNHWIRGGKYTSFAEYRFALKACLNLLLPTRTVRKRGGEAINDTSCQRCHEEQETLAHVLNHCPPNVGLVRARHNRILHRLANAIPRSKGVQLLEQTVPGDGMALKPDLVILNKDTSEAFVIDVTIPFEGEDSFRAARQGKVDKYNHLKRVLQEKGYRRVEIDGFVVGALGSWDPENEPVLRKLSIGQRRSEGVGPSANSTQDGLPRHPTDGRRARKRSPSKDREYETGAVGNSPDHDEDAEPGLRPEDVAEEEEERCPPLPAIEGEPNPGLDRTTSGGLEVAAPSLVDPEATARHGSGLRAVDIVVIHPSQTRFTCPCPGCQLSYPTHHSLVRHVGVSHQRMSLNITFKCAVCDYAHASLRSTSLHYRHAHGVVVPPQQIDGSNEKRCRFCPTTFPSTRSCSTHIREKHMEEMCAQRAREAAQKAVQQGESTSRTKWTQQEIERFKTALAKHGPASNIK